MSDETPLLTSAPSAAEAAAAEPASADAAAREEEAKPARGRTWPLIVLAFGLLVVAVAVGWVWTESRRASDFLRHEIASRLSASDDVAREARASARQGQESIADLQQRLARTEAQLAETRGQQAAMEAVYQSVSRNREDRLLVEVEQAVAVALQQLQLSGNVEAALVALRGAQSRLAETDAAPLTGLRKAIAQDIERLTVAPRLDVSGTALRIEVVLGAIDRFPLAFMAEPPALPAAALEPAQAGWREKLKRLGLELWAELRTLLRVERLDRPDPALLSPAQEVFLRENLRLRLLSARLALLSRDARTYAADLERAGAWIERYFDTSSAVVDNALAEIGKLAALDLSDDEVPTLNDTYAAMRVLQQRPSATIPEPKAPPAARSEERAPPAARAAPPGVAEGTKPTTGDEGHAFVPAGRESAAAEAPAHPSGTEEATSEAASSGAPAVRH